MLDAFLEVVSGHTKVAEAKGRLRDVLERLPTAELHKIASGEVTLKEGHEEACWLDKFKGTPLYDQALDLEKEDLDIQMQEQHRRQMETELRASLPTWDETDLQRQSLSVKRKLLELELAGANLGAESGGGDEVGGQEGEDAAPPDLEAAEAAAMPPTPKPEHAEGAGAPPAPAHEVPAEVADEATSEDTKAPPAHANGGDSPPSSDSGEDKPKDDKKPPTTKVTTVEKPTEPKEKIDVKAAAARMRFAMAVKEAGLGGTIWQGLKGMGQFAAQAAPRLATAAEKGGVGGLMTSAKRVGTQGLQQAGKFISANPAAGAAMIAAPAAAAGYAASR